MSDGRNRATANWNRGFSRFGGKREQPAEASTPAQHAAVFRSGSVPAHLQRSPDAVIVGGGLIGSSIAYHLARAGVRTLLIEQGDLASGASGANFGNVQVEDAEFGLSLELTLRSYARFAELGAELD